MNTFQSFQKNQFSNICLKKISQQPTFYDYYPLYIIALILCFLAKGVEFYASFQFFLPIFATKIYHTGILYGLVITLQILIETVIIFSLYKYLQRLYAIESHKNIVLLFIGLTFSSLLIYASVMGSGNIAQDKNKPVQIESQFDQKITNIEKQIKDIQIRNSWNGNTWLPEDEKKLLHSKEAELAKIKETQAAAIREVHNENQSKSAQAQYWMSAFELTFLLCLWFSFYFQYRIGVEAFQTYQEQQDITTNMKTSSIITPGMPEFNLNGQITKNPVGFRNQGMWVEDSYLKKYKEVVKALERGMTWKQIEDTYHITAPTISRVKKRMEELGVI